MIRTKGWDGGICRLPNFKKLTSQLWAGVAVKLTHWGSLPDILPEILSCFLKNWQPFLIGIKSDVAICQNFIFEDIGHWILSKF